MDRASSLSLIKKYCCKRLVQVLCDLTSVLPSLGVASKSLGLALAATSLSHDQLETLGGGLVFTLHQRIGSSPLFSVVLQRRTPIGFKVLRARRVRLTQGHNTQCGSAPYPLITSGNLLTGAKFPAFELSDWVLCS